MSTWNVITIERPGALTLDTLPDALTRDGEIWEGRDEDDTRVGFPDRMSPLGYEIKGRDADPDGVIKISGHSKWRADDAIEALIELSKTTGRITHHEEWDDDEVGQSVSVYENGAEVREVRKVSALVPANLPDLIADARKSIWRDPKNGDITMPLHGGGAAIMALLDALDPEGASA
jgi:hypothetical protein